MWARYELEVWDLHGFVHGFHVGPIYFSPSMGPKWFCLWVPCQPYLNQPILEHWTHGQTHVGSVPQSHILHWPIGLSNPQQNHWGFFNRVKSSFSSAFFPPHSHYKKVSDSFPTPSTWMPNLSQPLLLPLHFPHIIPCQALCSLWPPSPRLMWAPLNSQPPFNKPPNELHVLWFSIVMHA